MNRYNDDYIPKTEPYLHQIEAFELSKDAEVFALIMEPRTGKTKVVIDTVARLYEHGLVIGVLIIAWPAGVHENWIKDECVAHLPDHIRWRGFVWEADRWSRKYVQAQFEELLKFNGLRVFAVNAESAHTEDCRNAMGRFIKACGVSRTFGVGDETMFMQNPKSQRARVMDKLKPLLRWRRILDGAPISNMGPFGLWQQFKWLDPAILGHDTFTSFKAHHSRMEVTGDQGFKKVLEHMRNKLAETEPDMDMITRERIAMAAAQRAGNSWIAPAKDEEGRTIYRNLSEIQERIAPHTFRITFHEAFKDVPIPVYGKLYFEMGKEQRRVYDELRDEFRTQLTSGEEIDGTMAMVRYLRLQQVTSNFIPPKKTASPCPECSTIDVAKNEPIICEGGCAHCDFLGVVIEETAMVRISEDNPRLDLLGQLVKQGDQWLIWARFNQEIDDIIAFGERHGLRVGRYDGQVAANEKYETRHAFQDGKLDWFVGKGTSAGRGIPLWRARGHLFYSNFWSLDTRQQTEMRAEIAHRRVATEILDAVAHDSIDDTLIIPSLRANKDVSRTILGDPKHDWL